MSEIYYNMQQEGAIVSEINKIHTSKPRHDGEIAIIEAGKIWRITAVRYTALHPCVTGDIDIVAS